MPEDVLAKLRSLLALTRSPNEDEARTAAHVLIVTARKHNVAISFRLTGTPAAAEPPPPAPRAAPPPPVKWVCTRCGKQTRAGFMVCHSCETTRRKESYTPPPRRRCASCPADVVGYGDECTACAMATEARRAAASAERASRQQREADDQANRQQREAVAPACPFCASAMVENMLGGLTCASCSRTYKRVVTKAARASESPCPVCGSGVAGVHGGGCPAGEAERREEVRGDDGAPDGDHASSGTSTAGTTLCRHPRRTLSLRWSSGRRPSSRRSASRPTWST
jgi:hypothetical protein